MALMQTQPRRRTSGQTGLAKCALRWCTGGRVGELARRSFHQQGDDEFSEYPTSRQAALLGRQIAEADQRFEALEQQFDLPTQSVKLEDRFRRVLIRQAGQQQDVAGGLQRARIDFLAGLDGSGQNFLACDFSLVRRQAADNQAQRYERPRGIMRIDQDPMACDIPFEAGQRCEKIERLAVRRKQAKRVPPRANHQIRATVEDGTKVTRSRIPAIRQTNIAGLPSEPGQPLSALVVRQLEVIDPARQIVAHVQPPSCAVRTRLADSARIDHAQPPSGPSPVDLRAGLLEQLSSNERKPIRRIAQTTIQRWAREVGNRARLRPGTAAAQRTAACVDQGKPQQVGRTPYPPRAEKGLELACRFFNRHQLADPGQSRGPGTKPKRIAHTSWNGSAWLTLS